MAFDIRPSLILRCEIDEQFFTTDVADDIRRSFVCVAPSYVEAHTNAEEAPANTMRFLVKIRAPYWDATSEEANDNWEQSIVKWLRNMIYKVSSQIEARNSSAAEHGLEVLKFDWLNMEFGQNATIAFKTLPGGFLQEQWVDDISSIRSMILDGAFGENVSTVSIPSKKHYIAQFRDAKEALLRQMESEEEAEQQSESETDDIDEESAVPIPEEERDAEAVSLPVFEADCSIWGIGYRDGSIREFDSLAKRFLD